MPTENPEAVLRTVPFSRGMNFSQWFEASTVQGIHFNKYGEQDFIDAKSLGADVIRLPINMHGMTGGAPNYTIDPLLFEFLDNAVDWAEKHQLYIILDNHSFDPAVSTDDNIDVILLKVWTQMAGHYKNRSPYVLYEILNEPHGISDSRWGEIQGAVIKTIRQIDPDRTLIVGGSDWNSITALSALPVYDDPNLIYTFHFYDPFMFTHQGASWCDPSLEPLAGVPFPPDKRRMPETPDNLRGTWIGSALRNYEYDAAFTTLTGSLDKAVAFSRDRDVPVFCGEFGVYLIQSPPADRVKWYQFTTGALNRRNIPWTSWDYFGGFGLYNKQDGGDFNSDLNIPLVRAMGFNPPPQRRQPPKRFDTGFTIYDDYFPREFSVGYWGSDSVFGMYEKPSAEGELAIRWGNTNQYDVFWVILNRGGDFTSLVQGYSLEFKARAETPVRFDVRFMNPETSSSIPWRIRYSVDENILPADGQWHTIRIPLKEMREHGAWINATEEWLNPQGKFTWKEVNRLEFVSEDGEMKGRYVWIDSIKITEN
jgi:endoglucanase